jgi:hypothetical protein
MYLHKYKKGGMTFYAVMGRGEAPAVVELEKVNVTDTVPYKDVIKSYISDLEGALERIKSVPEKSGPKKPEKPKEPKKPEEPKELKNPENSEKTAISEIIRKYARILGSFDKE